jgi:hypothetical protein
LADFPPFSVPIFLYLNNVYHASFLIFLTTVFVGIPSGVILPPHEYMQPPCCYYQLYEI